MELEDGVPSNSERKREDYAGMRQPGARAAVLTLTAINFLNFADRYVPSAVKSLIQEELQISDLGTSLPNTG
jgi:hypothetical protein